MSLVASLNLVIILSLFLIGLIVFWSDKKAEINKIFFVLTVSATLWLVSNFFTDYIKDAQGALVFARLANFFGVSTVFLIFRFSNILHDIKRTSPWLVNLISIATCIVAALTLTPFHVSSVIIRPGSNSIVLGPLNLIPFIFLITTLLVSFYILYANMRSLSGVEKKQLGYVFYGLLLTSAASVLLNVLIPIFFQNSIAANFAPFSMIFFVGFSAYAITRKGIFNVKVITSEIAVAALAITNLIQVLTAQGPTDLLLRIFILSIVGVIGYLLVKSVRSEVSRREEVEVLAKEKTQALGELEKRNKNLATLQKISELVLNEVEIKTMAQKILDEIPKQLSNSVGALLNLTKDGHLVAYSISSTEMTSRIHSLIGEDLEKYSYPVKHDFNQIHAALIDQRVYESDNLSEFISPPISKPVALTLQKLLGVRHVIAQPLYGGTEPLGVLMFTYSVSGDQLEQRDRDMAKAVADDMSLAIQRAYAYQKLKDANEYLAELDKLKDEFISMASHELNTPLAAIEGYLSMVLDEGMGKVDPKAKEYLGRAYDSSKRLADLILDLLNVSRIEQGRLKMRFVETNFVSLAESVINELQIKTDAKKLSLKLEAPKKVIQSWVDPDRIREVFVNLVGNAIKFTEKGGITIRIKEEVGKIRCEVADTGRGVAPEDQKKLFQKFSQVHREVDEHQGTGLGLYISKNFVELHKGRIMVESEQGKGATFIFELPILKSAPEEVKGAILENGSINNSTINAAVTQIPVTAAKATK